MAEVETGSGDMISGRVTQVRQGLVEPATSDFSLQTSLYIETDAGEVSVGGPDSFIEDVKARSVTLTEYNE